MWELYDKLISGIPNDLIVDEVICGVGWTMVRSDGRIGLAMTISESSRPGSLPDNLTGLKLKELAAASKSWNFLEAGIGVAAINAFYNSPEEISRYGILNNNDDLKSEAFTAYTTAVSGKKVAVIGHFPHLEKTFAPVCELSILEKKPQYGDFPDSACEYILPEQDYVFITGVTLINKTLPRLLELSKNSKIVMVGPSVPLCPVLFDYGVYDLAGFVVKNNKACPEIVRGQCTKPLFYSGERVQFNKMSERK